MKPYYEHAGIAIYHGDCREVLASFPECFSFDALITDPPYGIGFDYGENGHDDDPAAYGSYIWPIVQAFEDRLHQSGYAVVFQSATTARMWPTWFPRDWRLFAAPKAFAQIRPCRPFQAVDYALYWRRDGKNQGKHDWHPAPGRDWYLSKETAATANRPKHPCPRPADLMRYIVSMFAAPSAIVIDPFMGSGTTLLAAKNLSRRAIGIEIEERYCEIAAKRLSQEVLFGSSP